jgi:signal transduction histidine kinase/ActR/RegA family two-component response regulator
MVSGMLALENIVIPVIGICMLLPIAVVSFFEPRHEYSRFVYRIMLYLCIGILVMEGMQLTLEGQTADNLIVLYRFIYCIFYILLISLCSCWTYYTYYWFHGYPPSRKISACLISGPVLELVLLIVNCFTGSIYLINEDGKYVRGEGFLFFIMFCYIYMLAAIALTAISAIRSRSREGDFRLFSLFFIFPVIGPVFQYMLPDLSVMGISEAIALLTVYVAVQQRTNAAYAVQKARYQDESLKYEKSLAEMMSVSPDALCIFHLNLTQNTRSYEHGTSVFIRELDTGESVEELFSALLPAIADKNEAAAFRETFSRRELMKKFAQNKVRVTLQYHRPVDSGEIHSVRAYVSMLKNPGTGDIEAILYSVDTDRQEKDEKVISALTGREYEYIALIDTRTGKINYKFSSENANMSNFIKLGDYDQFLRDSLESRVVEEQRHDFYNELSYRTVLRALLYQEEYVCVIPYTISDREILQKRITYRYLDEQRKEILFFGDDITEELKQESERSEKLQIALMEARHANTMKSEFLSNVSHDMRTPLNAVLGYTNLARQNADHKEEVEDYLDKIERAGKILLSLINDTLDLSKIETGSITLKPAPVECGEVIRKIMMMVQPMMDAKHIHFTLDNSRAVMAVILADALRLQDIFVNLVSNAVKFTPEGGNITLVVECLKLEDQRVHDRIIVRDSGCGMSPEFLPKAFEPFSQERQAQTAEVGGSGLGLSIVKKLVELMGGTIEVRSELGMGTEFTVLLDFDRAEVRPKTEDETAEKWDSLKGRHILLVEDNTMNTEIAKAVLEKQGMTVVCASNGEAGCLAFAESEEGYFDAVLMDIRMPVMNGHDAARKIRQMKRRDAQKVPIIAMSADAFDEDVKKSIEAGMNAHMAKPIDPRKVYKILSEQIG